MFPYTGCTQFYVTIGTVHCGARGVANVTPYYILEAVLCAHGQKLWWMINLKKVHFSMSTAFQNKMKNEGQCPTSFSWYPTMTRNWTKYVTTHFWKYVKKMLFQSAFILSILRHFEKKSLFLKVCWLGPKIIIYPC